MDPHLIVWALVASVPVFLLVQLFVVIKKRDGFDELMSLFFQFYEAYQDVKALEDTPNTNMDKFINKSARNRLLFRLAEEYVTWGQHLKENNGIVDASMISSFGVLYNHLPADEQEVADYYIEKGVLQIEGYAEVIIIIPLKLHYKNHLKTIFSLK